jgi:hypothetical protein
MPKVRQDPSEWWRLGAFVLLSIGLHSPVFLTSVFTPRLSTGVQIRPEKHPQVRLLSSFAQQRKLVDLAPVHVDEQSLQPRITQLGVSQKKTESVVQTPRRLNLDADKLEPPGTELVHSDAQITTPPAPALTAPQTPASTPLIPTENYFPTADVDQPAVPDLNWRLNDSRLPPGIMFNTQLQIWVNSDGVVQKVDVLLLNPDIPSAREALDAMLGTQIQPAMKNGYPVANVRTIEMWFGK